MVGVFVTVGVAVIVGVLLGVGVSVGTAVFVGVAVLVAVFVGVGVGRIWTFAVAGLESLEDRVESSSNVPAFPVSEKSYEPMVPVGKPIVNVSMRVLFAGMVKMLDHMSVDPESAGSMIAAPLNILVFGVYVGVPGLEGRTRERVSTVVS